MSTLDPVELNVIGVQQLVSSGLNKTVMSKSGQTEGVQGELTDDLSLDKTDEQLLQIANTISKNYDAYYSKIKPRQEANKKYYLGRQKEGSATVVTEGQPISANLIFEAVETFLPVAMAKNPEPVVWADNTPNGTAIAADVKTMLQYHADVLALRQKLTLMTRHWLINLLAVQKHGWDPKIQEITLDVRDPQNFIFDTNGYVDCYGDFVGMLGEKITVTAQELIDMFPQHEAYIILTANGKLGTKVTYTEWWNDDYCFYTFKDIVLDKHQNPHFNYDGGINSNHFARPKKPYTFLSVFSLEKQPHDETSLIEQNIPNQRRITNRTDQIDYNLSRQNNSTAYSGNNFTQEEAKQAAKAMQMGHPVIIPQGAPIDSAIKQFAPQGVTPSYFQELETAKDDLRSIFGTQGITANEQHPGETARGEILNTQRDNTRIGGGVGDKIERVADNTFNWWVQLYKVYYTDQHVAMIMGQMKSVEYATLSRENIGRKLVVSVSPNSMKSHDETTEMNQAINLYKLGVLDPKTLLTRLNFPDPHTTAQQTTLWIVDKMGYMQLNFPEVAQQLQTMQLQKAAQMQAVQSQEVKPEPAAGSLSNVPINTLATPT